jgi:hypothetical protein
MQNVNIFNEFYDARLPRCGLLKLSLGGNEDRRQSPSGAGSAAPYSARKGFLAAHTRHDATKNGQEGIPDRACICIVLILFLLFALFRGGEDEVEGLVDCRDEFVFEFALEFFR